MEYCSHIWGRSPSVSLLDDKIESKAFRLINNPVLTSPLDPPSLRRKVASLSLFYRYHYGRCSLEFANCVSPPLARPPNTRQSSFTHRNSMTVANSRISGFDECFFSSTSKLRNFLLGSVFPDSFSLSTFKRQVFHHLRGT